MDKVDKAYNFVRRELAEIGLLEEGKYLDKVELCVTNKPSEGEAGYVFESEGPRGYKPGVIYLPSDTPNKPRCHGLTLVDVIRHEFAHAWYCIDPTFFKDRWFPRTFGAQYNNCNPKALVKWEKELETNETYIQKLERCRKDETRKKLYYAMLHKNFVSGYASNCACEDFAETFMFFLKHRNSLDRFKESRPIVYKKLTCVERAVAKATKRVI